MSGLVGYIGRRQAKSVILNALERLEYRGYDSAGICLSGGNGLEIFKTLGRPQALAEKLLNKKLLGNIGIGHTRWASHGKPAVKNAHPIRAGDTAVAHNGILENAEALKAELKESGAKFRSETDSEVLPHLIEKKWRGSLLESVIETVRFLEGSFTFCVVSKKDPDYLIAVRKGNPLVVGLGEGEQLVASDATAVAQYTDRVVFLKDGEIAVLSHEGAQFFDFDGNPLQPEPQKISWDVVRSEKRGYRHYLLKEIVESPRAVRDTIAKSISVSSEDVSPSDFCFPDIGNPLRVVFCGSGSSYYASMIGQHLIESISGISASGVVASEFRHRKGIVDKKALFVAISQSGESLDTLESARFAADNGASVLAVTNNSSSSLARLANYQLITQAGPEISVVSSKTFSAMIMALTLLAFHLGKENGNLSDEEQVALLNEIRQIPDKMELTITHETLLRRLAARYSLYRSFFFVGRGHLYGAVRYSALMMKEVVNVHGEGLLAGEIKHGSISLIDRGTPVLFFANQDFLSKQILNDMQELKTRGAAVIAIGHGKEKDMAPHCHRLISVPKTDDRLAPMLAIAPAQLFIYYLGLYKRKDVDRPRNIAKSVTV